MSATITIQNIDEATEKKLAHEAERRGMTVEAFILDLIEKEINLQRETTASRPYTDLDSLAGTWDEAQATEFLNAINDFEQVDEKLWQ
jgi:t-SNARE complex subunit (syntaxin)